MVIEDYCVKMENVHIIMPVKDSIETAEQAIRAIVHSGYSLTVYDDYSSEITATRLDSLQKELGIRVVHIASYLNHPSPNYRWVLQEAQRDSLVSGSHLVIVESDVLVKASTIHMMCQAVKDGVGMVAAVTTDEVGVINFPYSYASNWKSDAICKKRLSFCCTLLTNRFLQAYDFMQLDPEKNWYDVTISHRSRQLGFENILQISNPVVHKPHSSRPWKKLKHTNPILYYWRKLIYRRDRI